MSQYAGYHVPRRLVVHGYLRVIIAMLTALVGGGR